MQTDAVDNIKVVQILGLRFSALMESDHISPTKNLIIASRVPVL